MSSTLEAQPRLQARVTSSEIPESEDILATAELLIAGAFVIKDIRIRKVGGRENWRAVVEFPCRPGTGAALGRFFDMAHPISAEAHAAASAAVLAAYRQNPGAFQRP